MDILSQIKNIVSEKGPIPLQFYYKMREGEPSQLLVDISANGYPASDRTSKFLSLLISKKVKLRWGYPITFHDVLCPQ